MFQFERSSGVRSDGLCEALRQRPYEVSWRQKVQWKHEGQQQIQASMADCLLFRGTFRCLAFPWDDM